MKRKTKIWGLIAIILLAGVWYLMGDNTSGVYNRIMGGDKKEELQIPQDFVSGDPNAPVTMIEYVSHFCGYCALFHKNTLPLIIDNYIKPGKVKLVQVFISGMDIGQAILCAKEQRSDTMMELNEYLIENIKDVSKNNLNTIVERFGINGTEFDKCFGENKYAEKVKEWHELSREVGVTGTPTFFIGDKIIEGNQPYSVFKEVFDEALGE